MGFKMPSNRAILSDIIEFHLNPNEKHSSIRANNRLSKTELPKETKVEVPIKNALKELVTENVVQPVIIQPVEELEIVSIEETSEVKEIIEPSSLETKYPQKRQYRVKKQ